MSKLGGVVMAAKWWFASDSFETSMYSNLKSTFIPESNGNIGNAEKLMIKFVNAFLHKNFDHNSSDLILSTKVVVYSDGAPDVPSVKINFYERDKQKGYTGEGFQVV